ncbi:LysR family transcriptional regulator [Dasania marina]|uniref:LysR family transcriptional regulator n=1 Tax=Dasania marina TaxID=471499 RepID=UPI0030D6F90A|tara:strand:+ start:68899 stop:69822 length:924 start_codon:yes stop_codon:yes gene_type:complete
MLGNIHDVDLKLLRIFHSIYECGGFTQAQLKLGMSQSNISAKMSQLEGRMGARLCERGKSGFMLTPDGEMVIRAIEKLFLALNEFKEELATTGSELKGKLDLGVMDNVITNPHSHIDVALGNFLESAPAVRLNVFIGDPVDLEVQVLDGRLDLVIGLFNKKHETLEYTPLYSTRHALFCGDRHKFFDMNDEDITDEDLIDAKYIDRGYLESIDEFQLKIELLTSNSRSQYIEGQALLVLSGKHIASLPIHYAQHWVDSGQMRMLKPEQTLVKADVLAVTRNRKSLPVVAERFLVELEFCHSPCDFLD